MPATMQLKFLITSLLLVTTPVVFSNPIPSVAETPNNSVAKRNQCAFASLLPFLIQILAFIFVANQRNIYRIVSHDDELRKKECCIQHPREEQKSVDSTG